MPIFLISALFYAFVYQKTIVRLNNKFKDIQASFIAFMFWAVLGLTTIKLFVPLLNFKIAALGSLIGLVVFYLLFHNYPHIRLHKSRSSKNINIIRFLVAGVVVSLTVILAKILGPEWGALLATFPATISMSLYFLERSQSDEFIKSFIKELPLSLLSTLIFIIVIYLTILKINVFLSFLVSMLASFVYTYTYSHLKIRKIEKLSNELYRNLIK